MICSTAELNDVKDERNITQILTRIECGEASISTMHSGFILF